MQKGLSFGMSLVLGVCLILGSVACEKKESAPAPAPAVEAPAPTTPVAETPATPAPAGK